MEEKKTTSLSPQLFTFFAILLSLVLVVGGTTAIIFSFLYKFHYYFEGLVLVGIGTILITALINIVLYTKSLEHTTRIVEEIDRSIAIKSMMTNMMTFMPPIPDFNGLSTAFSFGPEVRKPLESYTEEELEEALGKAITEEKYEWAAQIKAEKAKRK